MNEHHFLSAVAVNTLCRSNQSFVNSMAHKTRAGRVRPWTVYQDLVGMMYDLRVAANARELESNLDSIEKMVVMRETPSPEFSQAER